MTLGPDFCAEALALAPRFELDGAPLDATPLGRGHIHDTCRLDCDSALGPRRYVLQRMNARVFPDPVAVNRNIVRVTEHQRRVLEARGERTRVSLSLLPARDGRLEVRDERGHYWRAFAHIDNAQSYESAADPGQAYRAARAFGAFQADLSGLNPAALAETLPGFHDTPARYAALERVRQHASPERLRGAREALEFALRRQSRADALLALERAGKIPRRVAHNDTKIDNLLFDRDSGEPKAVIDLDTVMPGLSVFDFGDLVRSCTSPGAEDRAEGVAMRMEMFAALAEGYLCAMRSHLTDAERQHLALAGLIITLETGVRFLTDYLAGDVYFKIERPDQNLDRCRRQFALVRSIEAQLDSMNAVVKSMTV